MDIVSGFSNQIWRIVGYDSSDEIFEERIPLSDADETIISQRLVALASQHLSKEEIASGFAKVSKDDAHGTRITLSAGENPHYTAALFRADELSD